MSTDHFSGYAPDYARHRPKYPPELFAWLAAQCGGHELAWDCGTGNGQAAEGLAPYFRHIHATDLSSAQIAEASANPVITYLATPAENSGLEEGSCDLIVVAQALHWFCHERFYDEVRRTLKPGGIFAAWTYTLLRGEPGLNTAIDEFYRGPIAKWWPPERRWVDLEYRDMPFPVVQRPAPSFEIHLQWTLPDLLAYIGTWSATQRCIKETGQDPTNTLKQELSSIWPDPSQTKSIVWPITMLYGRLE